MLMSSLDLRTMPQKQNSPEEVAVNHFTTFILESLWLLQTKMILKLWSKQKGSLNHSLEPQPQCKELVIDAIDILVHRYEVLFQQTL